MEIDGLASIRTLAPLEEGGSTARAGFAYQDHVAAGYCILMLTDPTLLEIWCEAEDDITLIWQGGDSEQVELVQVKSDAPGKLWSMAMVCQEKNGSASIAAKSLAHDRCAEPCVFRLVTRVGVNKELAPLTQPLDHADRALSNPKMRELHKDVCTRLPDVESPRKRCGSHWVGALVWTVAESETAVENANLHALEAWLEDAGEGLLSDQRRDLYERLLRRIMKSSLPKWKDNPEGKKLHRQLFIAWVKAQIAEVKGISAGKAGVVLRAKMEAAGIDEGVIETAEDLRRRYRGAGLSLKYMAPADGGDLEGEAIAKLNHLIGRLDSGMMTENGVAFHAVCLDALADLQAAHPGSSFVALQAAMYVAAERCRHRFLPAST